MGKGKFPGMPGGMGNMNQMLKQAQKMQQDMAKIQEELGEKTVEVSVGGGAVSVVASGNNEIKEIKIKPEAVDPDDVEMLEDLVLLAVNEAIKKAEDMKATQMSKVTGGMNIPGMF